MRKKVLIFGGFGFVGTNLTEELIKRGNYEIIIFEAKDVILQNPDLLNHVKVYYGDFHNEKDYEIIFKENKIDIVFHLISTTVPSKSNQNILYDIDSNLVNSIKLLNLMKQYQIKNIIFPSSGGTIYGISKNIHKELDSTKPICSYGIMKLTIEKYLYLYHYLYDINYLILRLSNPFGKYHKNPQQGLINVVLDKFLEKKPIEIWGNGSIVRDYIFMEDIGKITVDLIEKNIQNEIINIGSGRGYSIMEIITIIKKIVGDFPIEFVEERKVDVPYIVLNIDKLNELIDVNLMSIEEAINKTYIWLKKRNI